MRHFAVCARAALAATSDGITAAARAFIAISVLIPPGCTTLTVTGVFSSSWDNLSAKQLHRDNDYEPSRRFIAPSMFVWVGDRDSGLGSAGTPKPEDTIKRWTGHRAHWMTPRRKLHCLSVHRCTPLNNAREPNGERSAPTPILSP